MSLVKTGPSLFENYTFIARPNREFSSSSSGMTGAIRVYPQASTAEKKFEITTGSFEDSAIMTKLHENLVFTGTNNLSGVLDYMTAVEGLKSSERSSKKVRIVRFVPSSELTKDTRRKGVVRSNLYHYYATAYPSCNTWGHFNYLTLNFISGTGFPSNAAIAYPNPPTGDQGKLTPSGSFTFEFYIKPTMRKQDVYHAGTIMHVSSSYAVSLISGSKTDALGNPDSFKILLQLSQSSEVLPSKINFSNLVKPNDLIFTSSDSISFNGWHHVAIRWGGNTTDFGTGSFIIDGIEAGTFGIPSSSLTNTAGTIEDSNALFVGNFYEGENQGSNKITGLFKSADVVDEGFSDVFSSTDSFPAFSFSHQLGAELHELRIWNSFRDIDLIKSGSRNAPDVDDTLLFYLGPHFVHESVDRKIHYSPFVASTDVKVVSSSFSTEMSFYSNGHLINAENHLRDRITGYFPRLLNMTSSLIPGTPTSGLNANDYLFDSSNTSAIRKNLLILPCDNGKFVPNFSLYVTSSSTPFFSSGPGRIDLGKMIEPISSNFGTIVVKSTDLTPVNLNGSTIPDISYVMSGTRDGSSNLVTFFDISNLFYGSKIHPGTFEVTDSNFTGSNGLLSFRLKDNGMGGLYRADANTDHAKWNSVGSIIYEEGIATITAPYFGDLFGKDEFNVQFKGERPVHTLTANVVVPAYKINSSSMPSYLHLTASDYANENSENFVYINRVNLHDENLNIIGRADLAQPIPKRNIDKFVIRTKFDF